MHSDQTSQVSLVEAPAAARPSLGGRTVALLEARRASELARLVETYGGVPLHAPTLREEPVDDLDAVGALVDGLSAGRFGLVIFQTGVGAAALLRATETLGRRPELLAALDKTIVAVRGPKPSAVLREAGVRIDRRAVEPHTTVELLDALTDLPLDGQTVAVQHYGEHNADLVAALQARGAAVVDVDLYRWTLPDDLGPIEALLTDALFNARVDALVVTSQVQVRHLFQVADHLGLRAVMPDLLDGRVVVAAVGPIAASALTDHGVRVTVQPEHPKMGALVRELAAHFATQPRRRAVCPE